MTSSLQTIRDIWEADDLGGREVIVRSNSGLASAIDALAASGGGIVRLDPAGGPYDVSVRGHRGPDGPLVITSIDAERPATVHSLNITRSERVAIADVKLDGGEADRQPEGLVYDGRDVVLVGIEATGRANGFLDGTGDTQRGDSALLVRESQDVTIVDSTFHALNHGIGALNTTGFRMIRNDISGIQGDGFRGGGLQDALFEGNHFHDFYGSTQVLNHSDMLQLWSTNVDLLNARIVIRDNVFDAGEMAATQTIFIGHEAYGRPDRGPSDAYEDILVEGNVIFNGARNGIVVWATNNAVIRDNTVLWNKDATTKTTAESRPGNDVPWIIASDMPGVVVENNITANFRVGDNARYAEFRAQNTILDFRDPNDPNYAYDHFVNLEDGGDARDLSLRTDSPFYGETGAPLSSSSGQDAGEPVPSAPPATEEPAPSAPSVTDELAPSAPPATEEPAPSAPPVTADPDDYIVLDFSRGAEDLSSYGTAFSIRGTDYLGDGTFLLRPDTGLAIDRGEAHLTNLEAFEIEVGFRKAEAGGSGALVGQHGRLEGEILSDGGIRFSLATTEGSFVLRTEPGLVGDTQARDLILAFDGPAGTMSISLDGTLVAEAAAGGILAENGGHTLTLGKAFEPNVEAEIDSFAVRAPGASAAAPAPAEPTLGGDSAGDPAPALEILKEIDFDGVMSDGIRLVDPDGTGAADAVGRDGSGFALDGRSKVIVSDRADVLEGSSGFEMSTFIAKDAAGGAGTILSIYSNMALKVLSDGSLAFWLKTGTDSYKVQTEAGLLSTTEWTEVGVRFDGAAGEMGILLGGEEVATGLARGALPEDMAHHLMVGRAFGGAVEARIDDVVLGVDPASGADQFEFAAPDGEADSLAAASYVAAADHGDDAVDRTADASIDVSGLDAAALTVDLSDALLVG